MVDTGRSSYGTVEDPRSRRFYGRHINSSSTSRSTISNSSSNSNTTSTNNRTTSGCNNNNTNHISNNTSTKTSDTHNKLRPSDEETRPSSSHHGKRRTKFGAGIVIVLASMILGYVLGSRVASARDDYVFDAAAATAATAAVAADAGAGGSFLAGQEEAVSTEEGEKTPFRLLSLQARNEYGVFDALTLYGLDMVVEPHKATVLSITGGTIARGGEDIVAEEDESRTGTGAGSGRRVQQFPAVSTNGGGGEQRGRKQTQQMVVEEEEEEEEETTRNKSFFRWVLTPLDEDGAPIPDAPPMLNVTLDGGDGGAGFTGFAGFGGEGGGGEGVAEGGGVDGPTITLEEAGTVSLLTVTEFLEDGRVVGEGRATVSCRYVRRELRELTEKDREAFLDAMVQFYTAPTVAVAGDRLEGLNYQHFAEVHNSDDFCYHNGMMFLTAHLAFDWAMERELQKINPAVSLSFWDYTIESGTLGADWPQSEIFGPSMFGSALGSADNGFLISDGRFANVSSIYDPHSLLSSDSIDPVHNPYGYISALYDYQDVDKLSRTHSFCGFSGTTSFPRCEDIVDCFDENNSLQFWSECMENNIHADMHGWLGGSWGCKADMGKFKDEHREFSDALLVFVLQFVTASRWSINTLFGDYNECDTSCTRGSEEPCGCRCLVNPGNMTDEEVYTMMEDMMVAFSTLFNAAEFVHRDVSKKFEYNFIQDGEPLKEEELLLLLRYIITVGCEPANTGAMATGASPIDPLFWVLHPLFERALHALWLSPEYRDAYDFSWADSDSGCYGSGLTDRLPFSEKSLGQGPSTSFLTNEDILRIAHPSNSKIPYVYSNFKTWGTCTDWNPCPQCTDEA